MLAWNLQIPPVKRKQWPDVLTDKKQENCDQTHADNLLVSLYRNNKDLKEEQSEKS
jgi:hypothetical protein